MFRIMFYAGSVCTVVFFVLSIIFFVKHHVAKLLGDVTGWNAKRAIKVINEKGAEEKSKADAIHGDTSKILVHDASTTGSMKTTSLDVKPNQSIMEAIQQATNPLGDDTQTDVLDPNGDRPTDILDLNGDRPTDILDSNVDRLRALTEQGQDVSNDDNVLEEEELLTTVLTSDAGMDVEADATDILVTGDECTNVLADDSTVVLAGEETGILSNEDEITAVLYDDSQMVVVAEEENSILNGAKALTSVLFAQEPVKEPKEDIAVPLTGEEQPMPSIFEVVDDITVVHTKDSIETLTEDE